MAVMLCLQYYMNVMNMSMCVSLRYPRTFSLTWTQSRRRPCCVHTFRQQPFLHWHDLPYFPLHTPPRTCSWSSRWSTFNMILSILSYILLKTNTFSFHSKRKKSPRVWFIFSCKTRIVSSNTALPWYLLCYMSAKSRKKKHLPVRSLWTVCSVLSWRRYCSRVILESVLSPTWSSKSPMLPRYSHSDFDVELLGKKGLSAVFLTIVLFNNQCTSHMFSVTVLSKILHLDIILL